MKIISISAYSRKEDFKKVYFNYENLNNDKVEELKKETFSNFEVLFFENEKNMLLKFKEDVLNFDSFFITGWNVIDFDFKILKNRFDKYEIDFNLSKT